ncbi:hypothetical protein [Intrasporangium sp.]|uniref:hypothetical protein n=1 Tax=Intrasporangium sp. TaxID=1925024 RepID=UPI0032214926
MAHTYTRATYVWFVAAVITGVASGFLHLVRSHAAKDDAAPVALTILAFGLTGVTALLIFRGIMAAADEQDRHAREQLARNRALRGPDASDRAGQRDRH